MELPPVDRTSGIPLARQIFAWFRSSILDGSLPAGERLPATRVLASSMGVSRNTAYEAYELLIVEGFIESSVGSRARVAEGVALRAAPGTVPVRTTTESGGEGAAGPRGRQPLGVDSRVDFRTGRPDPAGIPRAEWARALAAAARNADETDWLYGPGEGLPALRKEIASYLFRSRGLRVDPEAVRVTAGATNALHVLSLVLSRRGSAVAVEDPCHSGMVGTLRGAGLEVVPVEADEYGLRTELLAGAAAGAVYLTPSHQFPLGGVLPASRRSALVRWARERDAYLIEDDYDSEFRYSGPPIAPLWSLDPDRVVYVGTFSKTLFPALRVGFALVPAAIRREWRNARVHVDVQNPPFEQAALARLLADRSVDRHVARMRRRYARRRAVLLSALDDAFRGRARVLGDPAGLHVAVSIPGLDFGPETTARARGRGITFAGAERHATIKGRWSDTFLLGYGHLDESAIRRGVSILSEFLGIPGLPTVISQFT